MADSKPLEPGDYALALRSIEALRHALNTMVLSSRRGDVTLLAIFDKSIKVIEATVENHRALAIHELSTRRVRALTREDGGIEFLKDGERPATVERRS